MANPTSSSSSFRSHLEDMATPPVALLSACQRWRHQSAPRRQMVGVTGGVLLPSPPGISPGPRRQTNASMCSSISKTRWQGQDCKSGQMKSGLSTGFHRATQVHSENTRVRKQITTSNLAAGCMFDKHVSGARRCWFACISSGTF